MTHPQHFLFAVWMVGGIQTVFYNLKEAIAKRQDVRSSWLPIEMYPDDWVTKIPPISLNGTWRNSMATWWRMRPLEKRFGRFHAAYFLEHSIITFLWGFRRRVPFVLSTDMTPLFCARHELWYAVPKFDPASLSSRLKRAITRKVYMDAFHLLPWSAVVKESFIKDYGIPEDRITVLPPGINLKRWQSTDREADYAAAPGKPFTVLHVGWDLHRKGGDLLITLASEPEFRDAEFHFVTSSEVKDAPPNVFVHKDLKPNGEPLRQLYQQADVFALPTRADTFSMVALEAMASGLPVIISSVGGISDIVVEGETGYLIKPEDITTLRERLRLLRSDRALRLRLGTHGRKRVEERFNLHHHVEILMKLLTDASRSRRKEQAA